MLFMLVLMAAPIALVVGGATLMVFSARKRPRFPTCRRCGYDVRGSLGKAPACPECGASLQDAGVTPAGTGQRSARFFVGVGLAAAGLIFAALLCLFVLASMHSDAFLLLVV